jgi:hypothetical protein
MVFGVEVDGGARMVLRDETIKRFGYDPDLLKPKSDKFVIASCRLCGGSRSVRFKDSHRVCKKCGTYSHTTDRKATDCAVPGAVELPERPCRLCKQPTRKIGRLCDTCREIVLKKEREIDQRNGARHLI